MFLDSFVETTKEFKKLDEGNDEQEIIKTKKELFGAWSTMVFMRGPDKIKYGGLILDFSIQYAIKNNQYTKTLQEAVDVRHKVRFNAEKNEKSNTQKHIRNGIGG